MTSRVRAKPEQTVSLDFNQLETLFDLRPAPLSLTPHKLRLSNDLTNITRQLNRLHQDGDEPKCAARSEWNTACHWFPYGTGKRKDTGTDFTKGGADKSAFRRSRSGWKTLRCWFNIF